MKTRGVIIGKFMPPHKGHEYLLEFAANFADETWIFVCSLPGEVIPGKLRFAWIQHLFPNAKVVHIHVVNPQANRLQEGAHKIWAEAVRAEIKQPIDYVFASEDYGWNFARELGATFIPVDPSRDQFPVSGTEVRTHPYRYWHFIPQVVRPWFVKSIQVKLNHGDQKNELEMIRKLASLLETLYVPLYSAFFNDFDTSKQHTLEVQYRDRAQASLAQALRSQARFFLLRSSYENLEPSYTNDVDLTIQVTLVDKSLATDLTKRESLLELSCHSDTAAFFVRDAILDYYRDAL